ncbi:MAG: carboxylating nicotinate-nucleotide diphosphorylase [Candidatus Hydrogenedentes bacterium]|nr:carboxylating nicotinate-nucleotide diphosphorylase [Candidatus Hydrogenedentota bacterium]
MKHSIDETLSAALAEDIGHGDITSRALVDAGDRCAVTLRAKEAGVLSGIAVFRRAFELAGAAPEGWSGLEDGAAFAPGDTVAAFMGHTREVLSAERTALNFVQRLSGVATLTRRFADALAGLDCQVCDTRKTTPLLRFLEKDAVRHGGGANHRFNLTDGILIKENHIAAAGGIAEAIGRARANVHHLVRIEVEVTNLEELKEALHARADVIMLDNMDLETMAQAVRTANNWDGGRAVLEASGNVTLDRVRAIAETGVDFISTGAITHSAPAIDLSLLIRPAGS